MRRVAASLAPLLACPAFWIWHALGAILCVPAFLYAWFQANPDTGAFVAAYLIPAWSACVLTSQQRDILASPASFCLPGHRDDLGRSLLLVGIVASLIASLPLLNYPSFDGLRLPLTMWSAFCFGLIIYLLVALLLFEVGNFMTSLAAPLVLGNLLIVFPTLRILLQDVALFTPGWNTVVLAVVVFFTWRKLGSVDTARRISGRRFLSLQMALRRSAGEEFTLGRRREVLAKGAWNARRRILRQCFNRISDYPPLSSRRCLAATEYEVIGGILPLTPWATPLLILAVLVLLTVVGYAPLERDRSEAPEANAAYAVSCFLAAQFAVPMFTTMLMPAGRKERFWNCLAIAVSYGVVVLLVSVLTYIILLAMGRLFPPVTFGGRIHDFRPAELAPSFVPLVLLPMILVLKIVCKKRLLIPVILLVLAAWIIVARGGLAIRSLGPVAIAGIVLTSWAILVGVLHTYSFQRDLVRD